MTFHGISFPRRQKHPAMHSNQRRHIWVKSWDLDMLSWLAIIAGDNVDNVAKEIKKERPKPGS